MGRKYVATERLFMEAHGDIFVEEITAGMVAGFRDLVRPFPESRGKSARDHREIRAIAGETGELEIDAAGIRLPTSADVIIASYRSGTWK
jgi:hypothetical protein